MTNNATPFGTTADGKQASLVTLTNAAGLEASFSDYGATWVSMITPDRAHQLADVLIGFDDVTGYETQPFISSVVGRYANRISQGRFALDGIQYQLDRNEEAHHLHGGVDNLSVKMWHWQKDSAQNRVKFTCESPEGECGYPGHVKFNVTYQLTDANEMVIKYGATTDRPTHVNLTNHAYFNLGSATNIHQHKLRLDVDRYTPVNQFLIPTGQISPIPDSLDFSGLTEIGVKIRHRESLGENGLDHNLIFSDYNRRLQTQGQLVDPISGRTLTLATSEPAIQIYTANHFDGIVGKENSIYAQHAGLCLETQHYPDSPNQPTFPSTLLKPEEIFESTTVFQFGVIE